MSTRRSTRSGAYRRALGFTLIELMVTLAVAAVLLMAAAPSFKHLILSNRLTTSANAMVDALNLARLDAIKLNATTQFCGSSTATNGSDTLGLACGLAAGAVYALPQTDTGTASLASEVRAIPPGIGGPVQIASSGVAAVRFSGQGFGYDPGSASHMPFGGDIATICTTELTSDNQRIIRMTAGSIIATASSTGTCP